MGASQVPAASGSASIPSDNWVLISSVTPTASATTVTFSSISGYKKLMFRSSGVTTTASATLTLTFNGDTGTNYTTSGLGAFSASNAVTSALNQTNTSGLATQASTASGSFQALLQILDTNVAGVKNYSGLWRFNNPGGTYVYPIVRGAYFASAAITSVTLTTDSAYLGAGNVSLYGVLA